MPKTLKEKTSSTNALKTEVEDKPKLQRQNSSTLRKYGNVYESIGKNIITKDKCDKKLKQIEKTINKETKTTNKETKRKLNPYQLFFKEHRLAGKTPTEIGILWKSKNNK